VFPVSILPVFVRQKRAVSAGGRLVLILGLAAISGCTHQQHLHTVYLQPNPTHMKSESDSSLEVRDARTGKPMRVDLRNPDPMTMDDIVPGGHERLGETGGTLGEDIVTAKMHVTDPAHPHDYVDKSDVYWKLNWIRQQLLAGTLPSNLEEAVAKTRKKMLTTEHDRNYPIAEEAVKLLEEGLKHLRADRALQAAHINRYAVPWGGGREAIQRYINAGEAGFGGKALGSDKVSTSQDDEDDKPYAERFGISSSPLTTVGLSSTQKQALDILLDYETQYHASPDEMMRRAWSRAIERINKLRDELGLMNQEANSDGDQTGIAPGISRGALNSDDSAISDINKPSDTLKGPSDPFAK
jgi:hypothetical protein